MSITEEREEGNRQGVRVRPVEQKVERNCQRLTVERLV